MARHATLSAVSLKALPQRQQSEGKTSYRQAPSALAATALHEHQDIQDNFSKKECALLLLTAKHSISVSSVVLLDSGIVS